MIQFGKAVRAARLRAGLSQDGLAYLCQMQRGYISRMECHNRVPEMRQIERLANALGMTPWDLVREAFVFHEIPNEACTLNGAVQ